MLDSSGSVEQIYDEHVRWTVSLVEALPISADGVRVAAMQYAGKFSSEFSLGTYDNTKKIVEHLRKIQFQSGVTRTGYALKKTEGELFNEDQGAR